MGLDFSFDTVQMKVSLGHMAAQIQQHIDQMFLDRSAGMENKIRTALEQYDWEGAVNREFEEAVRQKAKSVVAAAIRLPWQEERIIHQKIERFAYEELLKALAKRTKPPQEEGDGDKEKLREEC